MRLRVIENLKKPRVKVQLIADLTNTGTYLVIIMGTGPNLYCIEINIGICRINM